MTIDERIARLEHYTAGLDEQSRKEREENRQLWRDTQRTLTEFIERTTHSQQKIAEKHQELAEQFRQFQQEAAERDRETDRRFRETDARIQTLVSAIGEFIRKQPK